jgi:enterochelin esterase family protein
MPDWVSTIYPGRSFEWYVYTPAGLAPGEEAALMVFQDGAGAKGYMPAVLDNLIAKGEIPKMVGVFVNPGFFIDSKKSDRSFEYDTLSDQYSQFLLQEILPEVEKTTPLKKDPAFRAIAGASSGGICAFTAAWEHPEQFGKVMSWIGSFTDIAHGKSLKEGGQNYPSMIRLTPKKPIRVFLQDGINDLDNQFGNWPLANEGMAKALAFAGYDYKFVLGNGNHSGRHGVAILPDTLRWLWRPN